MSTIDAEFDAAVALAERLGQQSPDHADLYDFYREHADAYGLWPEVCWSANLKADMTAEEFGAALSHGMSEWDI